MKKQIQRVVTGIIGAVLFTTALYLGKWIFAATIVLLALVGQYELYGMFKAGSIRPWVMVGLFFGVALALRMQVPALLLFAVVGFVFLLMWSPFSTSQNSLTDISATVAGAVYPSALFGFFIDMRFAEIVGAEILDIGDHGIFRLMLAILVIIWVTDIMAYVVGSKMGKTLLAPDVSPGKTWEGAMGGTMAAVIVACALKISWIDFLDWSHVVVIALICGIFSQLGDLAESRFKRAVKVKDSGNILPGHGGILDRFDGALIAVPLVYFYLVYVIGLLKI